MLCALSNRGVFVFAFVYSFCHKLNSKLSILCVIKIINFKADVLLPRVPLFFLYCTAVVPILVLFGTSIYFLRFH